MKTQPNKGLKRKTAFFFLFVFWLIGFAGGLKSTIQGPRFVYPDAVKGFPHPYLTDLEYYVVFPGLISALNLLLLFFAAKIPKLVAILLMVSQITIIIYLIFLSGGGL